MDHISGTLPFLIFLASSGLVTSSLNCSVKISVKFGGLFADCRGHNLQQVPRLDNNTVALDLSENNITLQNNDFNYPFLVYLNLSHNGLTHLPQNVFYSCQKLSILDLGSNSLIYNTVSYPQNVFKSLTYLQILNLGLNDNTGNGEYPDKIFRSMLNLEELTIDTFRETNFGPGFGYLGRLRVLNLSGKYAYCNIKILRNDTMSVFMSSNISMLDMSYCMEMTQVQASALSPLQHLSYLILEHATSLGLRGCLLSLHSLQGTNMTSLNFENVDEVWNTKDEQLSTEAMSYLENICVSELNIANNHIMSINFTSLLSKHNRFSKCIKHLDIHGNFIYGYGPELFYYSDVMNLLSFKSIEYLDVSGFVCYHKNTETKTSIFSFWSMKPDVSFVTNTDARMSRTEHNDIIYFFPPNLKTVIANSVTNNLILSSDLSFTKSNVLDTVSVCDYDQVVLEKRIIGWNKLRTLKIANNNNMTLSESFFDTFLSLENLYLNDVSLPEDYFYKHGRRLFSKLTKLKVLDLSGNAIRRLSEGTFNNNQNLETLILSNNRFRSIPINIRDSPNLQELKMDENKITFLDTMTTNSLDEHALGNHFVLDLSENKFVCLCESVYFVFWLQQNNYTQNKDYYYCTTEDATPVKVKTIDAERVWHRCTGKIWLAISVPLFVFILLVSVSTFLIAKHKTQTIYFFKNLIRKCVVCPKREDFQFDICLCYAERDWRHACLDLAPYLERHYGYKVYLHDKDSIPGDSLANSIMYGIHNSWKTVLLLTENFVEDGWSWFTMQVAVRAVTWRTPTRLIVLTDSVESYQIPNCILCVVDEDRIIPTPDQDTDESWDMLVRHIK